MPVIIKKAFESSPTPLTRNMAAAIKAINAKIRSNKVADYVCSTRKLHCSFVLASQACSRHRPRRRHEHDPLDPSCRLHTTFDRSRKLTDYFSLSRLLGPRLQLWYPRCSCDGHSERPGNVRLRLPFLKPVHSPGGLNRKQQSLRRYKYLENSPLPLPLPPDKYKHKLTFMLL